MSRIASAVIVLMFFVLILVLYFGTDLARPNAGTRATFGMAWLSSVPHPGTAAGWALLVASVSLVSLIGLFGQLGETRRRFRSDVAPYLRVDLAPYGIGGSWVPPSKPIGSDLRFSDLNPGEERERSSLDDWAGDTPLYLWVDNRQTGTAGIADNVQIAVELEYPDKTDANTSWLHTVIVRFSYLEADHLNRYEIARIDVAIPYLRARVVEVRYETMFRRYSTWAHGSAAFTLEGGTVVNDRRAFRQREGVPGRAIDHLSGWVRGES